MSVLTVSFGFTNKFFCSTLHELKVAFEHHRIKSQSINIESQRYALQSDSTIKLCKWIFFTVCHKY